MWKKETIWFNSAIVDSVTTAWFEHSFWQDQNALTGQAPGRGTTYFFAYKDHEYVLRHYLRGGLPGKLLTDQYWYSGLSRTRAWRELNLLLQLEEMQLPAPRAIAARVERHGFYYRSDIITSRIVGAEDIHHLLKQGPLAKETWRSIGEVIARFHHFHVYHHDLNIHNIMLDTHNKVWLIDFDKCDIRASGSWKQANLNRLQRSLHKEMDRNQSYHFDQSDWQMLIEGYQQARF